MIIKQNNRTKVKISSWRKALLIAAPIIFNIHAGLSMEKQDNDALDLMSRHTLRFLGQSPTLNSLNRIEPGDLGLFCEGDKLYCKFFGNEFDKIEVTVDVSATETTKNGLPPKIFDKIIRTVKDDIKGEIFGVAAQQENECQQGLATFNFERAYESMAELETKALFQFLQLCGYMPHKASIANHTVSNDPIQIFSFGKEKADPGEGLVMPAKKSMLLIKPELFTEDAIPLNYDTPLKLMNKRGLNGYFGHPFDNSTLKQFEGKIMVTTDHNKECGYQLESQRFVINEGDIIEIIYDITVDRGRMSLGLLGATRTSWLDNELILEEGKKAGIYKVIVPAGQTKASLVFRNYHLAEPGHSDFTIENIKIEKKMPMIKLEDSEPSSRYFDFLVEYNSIGENHQCLLKNIQGLHFASMGIGDESAKSIAIGIKYNTVLNYVDLNHNNITAEGIKYLVLPLSGKPITQFHMHGSKIGDEGHKELAKAIKTWTNITHLNLNCTDLSDKGIEALMDALKGKNKLVICNLGTGNNMSSEGSEKMFKTLANRT